MIGGSLTGLTVTRKFVLLVSRPSLTVTVMRVVPFWLVAGVTVTARFVPVPPKTTLAAGTSVRLLEVLVKVKLAAAVSTSPIMKGIGPVDVSSLMAWGGIAEMVGASLTAVTVRRKLVLVPPKLVSVSEMVMVE